MYNEQSTHLLRYNAAHGGDVKIPGPEEGASIGPIRRGVFYVQISIEIGIGAGSTEPRKPVT